ncbi:unnamed protein product [Adineta ricciae]|uniref:G-protein coupled receptors family 1 profile domain-containing protein n=1 Tax=Adineta ricciae TaxID=249248 RepID=A0A815IED8_ADIRI|nr:unnamed protein product [Adineta ricciae]CAF1649886.1 unnamed protein product [Adineta ricciae]
MLFLMTTCILPILFMVIFGILTFLNVRQIRNRVGPQEDRTRNDQLRFNDRQLIRMLLTQVTITTLLAIPYCCVRMFSTFGLTFLKLQFSPQDRAIYNLFWYSTRTLYYTNCVIGFYVYTLSSSKFNAEFKRCTRYGFKKILTATGLVKCLSMRTHQSLTNGSQIDGNIRSLKATEATNRNPVALKQRIIAGTTNV